MATYVIFQNVVTDAEKMSEYIPRAFELINAAGGEVIVFDEDSTILDGDDIYPRTIVIRFKSREDAAAWYQSPEYRQILHLRLGATSGNARIVDDFDVTGT